MNLIPDRYIAPAFMTRSMLRAIFRNAPPPPVPVETELQRHNRAILHESAVSHVTLPPMFVLWRHLNHERAIRNGLTHEQAHCAVCIVTERVGSAIHPLWKLTLVEQPLEALGRCQVSFYPDTCLSGQEHKIIVQRPNPNPDSNNKLFLTNVKHSRYAIRTETGQFVPILNMTDPCLVLHSRFINIDTTYMDRFGFVCDHGRELVPPTLVRRDEIRRDALLMAQRAARTLMEFAQSEEPDQPVQPVQRRTPRPPVVPPPAVAVPTPVSTRPPQPPQPQVRATMPQHIVNTVIESLVAQETECPILQTALEKETTCLTPCGHAMTTDAAARWIRDAHSCPECRSPCSADQLQVWRA